MNKFEEFFYELSNIVKGWSKTTLGIIVGVVVAVAFYFFAKMLKSNKSEGKATMSWSALFVFLICLCILVLITTCLNY